MTYQLKPLTQELLFLAYDKPPGRVDGIQMVEDIQKYIEATPHPIYILANASKGAIRDMGLQLKFVRLTAQPGLLYAAVFGFDGFMNTFANVFLKLNRKGNVGFFVKATDALNKLKSIKPDILDSVDKAFLESLND